MIEGQELKNEEIRQIITNFYGQNGEIRDFDFLKNFGELLLEQNLILSVYDKDDNEVFCVYCMHKNKCNHTIDNTKEMMKNLNPKFKGTFVEKN